MSEDRRSPLADAKAYDEPSVFEPPNLLDEARRQKGLPDEDVPEVCVLDPDGDVVRHLLAEGRAEPFENWPGYHTDLYTFERNGRGHGTVGNAVAAQFGALVAEQLFAAGCELLVSVTSAGRIEGRDDPPYFVPPLRAAVAVRRSRPRAR
jgi:uridine phosphorylase